MALLLMLREGIAGAPHGPVLAGWGVAMRMISSLQGRHRMGSNVRVARAAVIGLGLGLLARMPAIAPVVAQEYKAGPIRIEAPWIRATPAGAQVAGGYMKIENTGKGADRLVGGTTAIAGKFEVHEMQMVGTVMKMRELDKGLEVPAGQSVELKPGSYHLMLLDLKARPKAGDKINGTLVFEKAGKVDVEYSVRGAGAGGQTGDKH
jgi:copper(I)-binding protein